MPKSQAYGSSWSSLTGLQQDGRAIIETIKAVPVQSEGTPSYRLIVQSICRPSCLSEAADAGSSSNGEWQNQGMPGSEIRLTVPL